MISISKINFECQRCGKCCKHRGDLALTPMDVFQISKFLRISCEEMVKRYTQLSHRHDFPQIVLQGVSKQSICIFYDKRKGCTIYPVRPTQCYLFPLATITSFKDEQFRIQHCPGHNANTESQPVLDWIRNSSPRYESEKDLFIWYLEKLPEIDRLCHLMNSEHLNKVKELMYYDYDLTKDMESQIRFNLTYKLFSL